MVVTFESTFFNLKTIIMNYVWFLLLGAAAGWLAGQIMKGGGFGLIGNIIVGVLGAVVGGWLAGLLHIGGGGLLGELLIAAGGCVVKVLLRERWER